MVSFKTINTQILWTKNYVNDKVLVLINYLYVHSNLKFIKNKLIVSIKKEHFKK